MGGHRLFLSRGREKNSGDVDHPRLCVEVKHWKNFGPRAARAALAAMPDGPKIRVVVHREKGRKGADAWACYLDLADLWLLCGAVVSWHHEEKRSMGILARVALADLARLVRL